MNKKGVELSLFLWVQHRETFPFLQGYLEQAWSRGNGHLEELVFPSHVNSA